MLYNKRLNTLEDLKREKKALKKAARKGKSELVDGINPFSSSSSPDKEKKAPKNDEAEHESLDILKIVADLVGAHPLISAAFMPIVKEWTIKIGKKAGKAGMSVGFKLLKEVLIAYLKWKLLEFSFKTLKKVIKARKDNNTRKHKHTSAFSR